jgi:type IV pilus assembly protein PilE
MQQAGRRARRTSGYTLIELLVTVSLIAFLGSLAYPNYALFVAKSRRSEAIVALSAIYKWQVAYYADHGIYADTFDQMGFGLAGAKRIDARTLQGRVYTYTMTSVATNGVFGSNYQAIATGDIDPSDPVLDILMIENDLTLLD